MGLFDTFIDVCPYCLKQVEVQSKQFECELTCYYVGDKINDETIINMQFISKFPCYECKKQFVISIKDNKFQGFIKMEEANPTYKEKLYGEIEELKQNVKEDIEWGIKK